MRMTQMKQAVGMLRLTNPAMRIVAFLGVTTQAATLLGQVTPVAARKLEVIRTDTLRATRRSSLVDRIDSLIRLQDSTAIGSPEYVRINRELNATIHAMLPPGLISG